MRNKLWELISKYAQNTEIATHRELSEQIDKLLLEAECNQVELDSLRTPLEDEEIDIVGVLFTGKYQVLRDFAHAIEEAKTVKAAKALDAFKRTQ